MMLKNEVWKIGKTFLVIFMFCVIYFVCFYNQIDFKKNINFSLSHSGIYNSSNCTIEDAIKKVDIQQISILVDKKLKKIKNQKTILEWTDPVYDTEILKELPTYCGKCKLSLDRKKEKEADAILFEFNKIHPIPESRHLMTRMKEHIEKYVKNHINIGSETTNVAMKTSSIAEHLKS